MGVKVFVLGRPGSGKSTGARYIRYLAEQASWSSAHFNDYHILQEMFLADTEHKQFRPTEHNGFDAIDLSVLDCALQELERRVQLISATTDLVTIEFARDDYQAAFKHFSPAFLRDASVLFLHADLDTCLQRVHERVSCAFSADDHPSFSDDIFKRYYAHDETEYILTFLKHEYGIGQEVCVLNNMSGLEHLQRGLELFVQNTLLLPSKVLSLTA
ncbi:hypothetical protein [Ktedonobacter robiniae]|uniref:Deoxynucleoside kinase domain-containing protein n=1 Tax=Ktedonobacter robiniae TaxID=2778365 RepID=A0ABQ3UMN8_9CHLR|nr:hypothetical protein [Ktedonobacter robiniae]GHO53968.1 hypothetical protein KSB_24430 [Ktedonobacter robiniae]